MRIELQDLRKRYGAVRALDGLTLEVPTGQRLALVGPNGSGKSTLLRAILGLVACEGQIRLDGCSPFDDRDRLAYRLAYVPQIAPQLGATVSEVVRAIEDLRGRREGEPARVEALASDFGLRLSALGATPFRALSGGMKQKLLLSLALAARPDLLVLDEPAASLDSAARETLFAALAALPRTTTLLLCSHRLDEVRALADRAVALADGRLAFDGAVDDALEASSPPDNVVALRRTP